MQASTSNQGMFWEEARELFEEIVGWLDSPSVCGLEHSEIESKLLENGYELLRRLLQGYFDKRSGDEIEGECTGSDEANRTHKKKLSRKLTTIFGTVIAGEKRNSKRMATVASVYTINPFVRTAQQIVNPSDEDKKIKRPRPIGKRVWASLVKQPEIVISEAFDEGITSRPKQTKTFLCIGRWK
jgi:hypothetical protein